MTTTCPECMQPMDEMCFSCGVFFEKPKFELSITTDTVKRITRSYLKVFHFKEILNEIQGRENITIHPDLLGTIKQLIPENENLNVASTRTILKPLKLHMLMPHSQYLINRLTNRPLPYIPREKENKLMCVTKQNGKIPLCLLVVTKTHIEIQIAVNYYFFLCLFFLKRFLRL